MADTTTPSVPAETPAAKPKRSTARAQERFMMILTGVFIVGVLLMTLIPEGLTKDLALAAFVFTTIWVVFKFGL